MAISVKLDPLGLTFTAMLDEIQSPKARSAALAAFARERIDEAAGVNRAVLGRPVSYKTLVDGRRGAAIDTVRPDGVVVAEFDLVQETLIWIAGMLKENSPVLTGQYRSSHDFLADGEVADINNPPLDASEFSFVSNVPYARKIERGLSSQAPDGVYQVTAELASRRFGNIAQVRFSFRAPLYGSIDRWASGTKMASPSRRGRQRDEWLRRQPAIVITVR